MRLIAKLAVAATILVALGILVSWLTVGGGSTGIAFADVAKALDNLRSATFDLTSEATGENGKPAATAAGKGFFLAPSRQRIEVSVGIAANPAVKAAAEAARRSHAADSQAAKAAAEAAAQAIALMPKMKMTHVTIADSQAAKAIMLMPNMKIAVVMDMKKMYDEMKKSASGLPPDLFEMVRRVVREGSSGTGEKVKRLGKREIDGQEAVGFWVRKAMNGMGDMTLWADPQTARPIRIELAGELGADIHMVMNNFRYDVDLDPSLFSLEPPVGYSTQTINMTLPVEADLLRTLRMVAEHNKGVFPERLSMNKEILEAAMAGRKPAMPPMDKSTQETVEAEMEKIAAKYGGKEKLRAKYGGRIPPEIMAEFMKATMPLIQEQTQKQMREQMPPMAKDLQGITFYTMLKPKNDPHYAGKGVKLGTPDRPIVWYKPTGAAKYRVIYADLSVKELAPEEVRQLPEDRPTRCSPVVTPLRTGISARCAGRRCCRRAGGRGGRAKRRRARLSG
jgi:outer membrane lipoprotein-sorting protein